MREALNKWAPTGSIVASDLVLDGTEMPRLRPDIGNAVFYLYRDDPQTGKRTGPHGSGFIVGRPSTVVSNLRHYYGISNWHLTNDLGASIIRINTTDGKSRFIEFGPGDWEFTKNGDDLSIVDLTDREQTGDQANHYVEVGFIDKKWIERFQIGLGEDVFMTGLFVDQHGGERNTPAARFGNVALMADDNAPIEQPNGMLRPSHLVDMRSRTGFSGSPVVLFRFPEADLSDIGTPRRLPLPNEIHMKAKFLAVFGVHCGQYYDEVEVFKTKPTPRRQERLGDPIHEGDKLYIQGGMTIVVPAWRITELLNSEVFEMARKKREERVAAEARRRPQREAAGLPTSDPPTDANPNAREDFNSLLDAAVKTPAQED